MAKTESDSDSSSISSSSEDESSTSDDTSSSSEDATSTSEESDGDEAGNEKMKNQSTNSETKSRKKASSSSSSSSSTTTSADENEVEDKVKSQNLVTASTESHFKNMNPKASVETTCEQQQYVNDGVKSESNIEQKVEDDKVTEKQKPTVEVSTISSGDKENETDSNTAKVQGEEMPEARVTERRNVNVSQKELESENPSAVNDQGKGEICEQSSKVNEADSTETVSKTPDNLKKDNVIAEALEDNVNDPVTKECSKVLIDSTKERVISNAEVNVVTIVDNSAKNRDCKADESDVKKNSVDIESEERAITRQDSKGRSMHASKKLNDKDAVKSTKDEKDVDAAKRDHCYDRKSKRDIEIDRRREERKRRHDERDAKEQSHKERHDKHGGTSKEKAKDYVKVKDNRTEKDTRKTVDSSKKTDDANRNGNNESNNTDNNSKAVSDSNTENDNVTVTNPKAKITEGQRRAVDLLTSRTGGAYIPPAKLRLMQAQITDKSSAAYQRIAWEALKKSIHGFINKVNVDNIAIITRELIRENIIRGRGLLCRSIIQAQAASPTFTHVYAALVAIINSKFPSIGELLLKRLVIQFKRAYRRNDKAVCLSSTRFIAHLVNQRVAHEILALEILTLLVETPTDDSVEVAIAFLKECGMKLTEVSLKGIAAIFEMLKNILHEGKLDVRVQYMIEVVFQVRKDGFKDHQSVIESLELVDEDDQFTHLLLLDEATVTEDQINVFKFDDQYEDNENKYKALSKEVLGSDSGGTSSGSGSDSGSGSESSSDDENATNEAGEKIVDNTETNLIALRRTIYLTINSSLDYEECAHKLMKMQLKPGQEVELCNMFLDCCAEQRTYEKFYGLLAQRFCSINKMYVEPFEEIFKDTYHTTHRLDTNRLRNVSKFFAHLLYTNAISWDVLDCIKLNEDDTTSSSRIFIKILFQELAEYMGMAKLNNKLKDEAYGESVANIFPKDNPRNTRFSINFFTSIGLGGLTDELRHFLKSGPTSVPAINSELLVKKSTNENSSSSSSSGSSEDSSESSTESSTSDSDSSESYDENEKMKETYKHDKKRLEKLKQQRKDKNINNNEKTRRKKRQEHNSSNDSKSDTDSAGHSDTASDGRPSRKKRSNNDLEYQNGKEMKTMHRKDIDINKKSRKIESHKPEEKQYKSKRDDESNEEKRTKDTKFASDKSKTNEGTKEKERKRRREKSTEEYNGNKRSRKSEREKSLELIKNENIKNNDKERAKEHKHERNREHERDYERGRRREYDDRKRERNSERDRKHERKRSPEIERNRESERKRENARSRERERDRTRVRSPECERNRVHEQAREQSREHGKARERARSHERERSRERDRSRDRERDRKRDRNREYNRERERVQHHRSRSHSFRR